VDLIHPLFFGNVLALGNELRYLELFENHKTKYSKFQANPRFQSKNSKQNAGETNSIWGKNRPAYRDIARN